MLITWVLFVKFELFFDILEAHEKLYKTMCFVQNVQNGPILIKSPTYNSWFFLKNQSFLTKKNSKSEHII